MRKGGWGLRFEKNAHIMTCSGHSTCTLLNAQGGCICCIGGLELYG
jgi:hypothetical protein